MTAASTEELLSAYVASPSQHLRATEAGDDETANLHRDIVAASYRQLRGRGEQKVLLQLLTHADRGVRGWAAAHALEFAPAEAEPALEQLSGSGDRRLQRRDDARRMARREPRVPLAAAAVAVAHGRTGTAPR